MTEKEFNGAVYECRRICVIDNLNMFFDIMVTEEKKEMMISLLFIKIRFE